MTGRVQGSAETPEKLPASGRGLTETTAGSGATDAFGLAGSEARYPHSDPSPSSTSGRVPSPCEVTGDRHLTDCACRPADDGRMDSYGTPTGWFADLADEEERDERMPWQPFLQASGGCFPLPLWFATESACQDWIRAHVIGNGWLVNHIRNYGEPSDA